MLFLISLGLADGDLSLRGLEAAQRCRRVYAEFYTTPQGAHQHLERLLGRRVIPLKRDGLEEKAGRIVSGAATADVGVLVGGDALFATTHSALLLECRRTGVPYEVVHGPSIFTAAGEAGLSLYKFGETVTVPRWKAGYEPRGFYRTILKNRKAGLHSLVLLEIDMKVEEAVNILLGIEKKRKRKLFQTEKVVSISCAGSSRQMVCYGPAAALAGEAPAVLIVPGRLNAFEKEFLETL